MSETLSVKEAGRIGGLRRWADHAPVRPYIGDLPNATRRRILAFVEAERHAQEREQMAAQDAKP